MSRKSLRRTWSGNSRFRKQRPRGSRQQPDYYSTSYENIPSFQDKIVLFFLADAKRACVCSGRASCSSRDGRCPRSAARYSNLLRIRWPTVFLAHRRKTEADHQTQTASQHFGKSSRLPGYRPLPGRLEPSRLHSRAWDGQHHYARRSPQKGCAAIAPQVSSVSNDGNSSATDDRDQTRTVANVGTLISPGRP